MPFFSIIIPVYNVAPYLRECLDSVLAQTFKDWEAICVDDGSTDGSGEILDEYAAKDSRFRVFHQPNAGVSAARNKALDEAMGEWVCFIDADDSVREGWLLEIHEATMQKPSVDWVRTRFCEFYEDERIIRHWPAGYKNYECDGLISNQNMVKIAWERFSNLGVMWINSFRRSIISGRRFATDLIWAEDSLWGVSVAVCARSCRAITNDDYLYRIRAESVSHSSHPFSIFIPFLNELYRIWKAFPGEEKDGTHIITKNFMRISRAHGDYTWRMGLKLRKQLKEIERIGGFSCGTIPKFNDRLRWRLFMLSGWLGFLSMPINPVCIVRRLLSFLRDILTGRSK